MIYIQITFNELVSQQNKENIILIKNSLLTEIHNKKVFYIFRILMNNSILFDDYYYRIINVCECLEMFFEKYVKIVIAQEEDGTIRFGCLFVYLF